MIDQIALFYPRTLSFVEFGLAFFVFSNKRGKAKEQANNVEKRLYEEIGRLKIELDWLKKKV